MSKDSRKIREAGKPVGTFTLSELMRMVKSNNLERPVEFRSSREKAWLSLAGIMFDITPTDLRRMRSAGIVTVRVLGSGEEECPARSALLRDFAIDELPSSRQRRAPVRRGAACA